MFSGNFRHPLDNLIRDDRLFMLEAILPFVADNMKAPLAMYIKIMELQSILSSLNDKNYMEHCGLHKDINNQDDILSSLADCGLKDVQSQFANIKKMVDMMKIMEASKEMQGENDTEQLYQHYNRSSDNFYEREPDPEYNIHKTDDLYGSIRDLFDEYDRNSN